MAKWPSSGLVTETDPVASAALDAHKAATTAAHGGVVAANDVRLTDARTPTAHRLSHGSAGVDPLSPADIGAVGSGDVRLSDPRAPLSHGHVIADTTGLQTGLDGKVGTSDVRLSDARAPTAHKASHGSAGVDPLSPADIGAAPLASPAFMGTLKNTVAEALKWEAFTGATQMVAIRSDNVNNLGVGVDALSSNTVTGNGSEGVYNLAFGFQALAFNTTGQGNTSFGVAALYRNTTGSSNVALGRYALLSNRDGNDNIALGVSAMQSNTTGSYNFALGRNALYSNASGLKNVGIGVQALFGNTTGSENLAIGVNTLYAPGGLTANATTTALRQIAIGGEAGQSSATQVNDVVAVGYRALVGAADTVALGSGAQALHLGSVALGKGAVTTAADQVMVGARDVEITSATKGVVLRSLDGTRYRLTVASGGALTTAAV